jgi:hypothetical protein
MDTQQTNLTVASKKELLGKKEKMKRKAINETEGMGLFYFFLSSGGGRDEGLDHLGAASSIEVGQSLPPRVSPPLTSYTQRSSAQRWM